jgi:hypothetical protein
VEAGSCGDDNKKSNAEAGKGGMGGEAGFSATLLTMRL